MRDGIATETITVTIKAITIIGVAITAGTECAFGVAEAVAVALPVGIIACLAVPAIVNACLHSKHISHCRISFLFAAFAQSRKLHLQNY